MTTRSTPRFAAPDKRRRPTASARVAYAPHPAVATKAADPSIAALVAKVDPAILANWVGELAHFPTRHSLSPHNVEAASWLKNQFAALGYPDTQLQDVVLSGQTRHNVVCTKPGTASTDEYVLIGAHYDSRMSNLADAAARAPGADDNATGTAGLLELARLLRPVDTRRSIRFAAFTGEEQGLLGSTAYADKAHAGAEKIRLMINLDMIGHPKDPTNPTIIVERDMGNALAGNDAASQLAADRMAAAAMTYTPLQVQLGPIYDSDYMPFEHFGYVCIGAFDGADNQPFYHSVTDTPDKVVSAFHADVVRMVLATVVGAAG